MDNEIAPANPKLDTIPLNLGIKAYVDTGTASIVVYVQKLHHTMLVCYSLQNHSVRCYFATPASYVSSGVLFSPGASVCESSTLFGEFWSVYLAGAAATPVEPNPPAPRPVVESSSTT